MKIRVVYLLTSCKKLGPVQQVLNIIKNLDRDRFEPVLVTIYDEPTDGTSLLKDYLPYVEHHFVPTGKAGILRGKTEKLRAKLEQLKPDVIHSMGVFPDFAVCRMKKFRQVITLRNFVYDDYPTKFGFVRGMILARLHLYTMKRTARTVACSESLSVMYREKLKLEYGYIRNGVDVEKYTHGTEEEKIRQREKLGLPKDSVIFVYSGQMIDRKNQKFLLEVFEKDFRSGAASLLLLGDGADYEQLKESYGKLPNVYFTGNVTNVEDYLKASDVYVSTSKSEGMPNGVLEAMAVGLPIVLSDIEQHREVFRAAPEVGFLYRQGERDDLSAQMKRMMSADRKEIGERAYRAAHDTFSASAMSRKYQQMYEETVCKSLE